MFIIFIDETPTEPVASRDRAYQAAFAAVVSDGAKVAEVFYTEGTRTRYAKPLKTIERTETGLVFGGSQP